MLCNIHHCFTLPATNYVEGQGINKKNKKQKKTQIHNFEPSYFPLKAEDGETQSGTLSGWGGFWALNTQKDPAFLMG